MPVSINGNTGVVTGVGVGGLPDGIVDTDMLAANAVTSAKASGSVKGITQADEWRMNTSFSAISGFLTSNWERNDEDFSLVGSGMTESSGTFTFPETGIYRISFYIVAYQSNTQVRYIGGNIHQTSNNSTYNKRSNGYASISNDSGAYCSTTMTNIFDVTDTSTHKVKFEIEAEHAVNWDGSSSENRTYATFIRLGDT